jgi:hypothetical protein
LFFDPETITTSQLDLLVCARCGRGEVRELDGFGQEVFCAEAHRFDRSRDVAVSGQHDHGRIRITRQQHFQQT